MGDHPTRKGPGDLVDVQEPFPPGSKMVHPNTQSQAEVAGELDA